MQISQIVTEQMNVNNAQQLKTAFNETQWRNIEHALLQMYLDTRGQGLVSGISDSLITSTYNRLKGHIGSGIPTNYTTNQWQTFAARYQISVGVPNPSWSEIAEYLSQFADQTPPEELTNITSQAGQNTAAARANAATPESRSQLLSQLQGPNQFETIQAAREYMMYFLNTVSQMGGRDREDSRGYTWADYVQTNLSSQTRIQALWRRVLAQHVTNSGTASNPEWTLTAPIPRATLNNDLWEWLLVTDRRIRQTRWNDNSNVPDGE